MFADSKGRFPIHPIWSPDGTKMLFALDPNNDQFTHPNNALWQTRADGSHPTTRPRGSQLQTSDGMVALTNTGFVGVSQACADL